MGVDTFEVYLEATSMCTMKMQIATTNPSAHPHTHTYIQCLPLYLLVCVAMCGGMFSCPFLSHLLPVARISFFFATVSSFSIGIVPFYGNEQLKANKK